MNLFKKLRHYFIGGALAKTDDVFEQVKAEVLFNFMLFFLVINIPYLFVSFNSALHFAMGTAVTAALLLGLFVIKKTNNVKLATYFFLVNFTIQDLGHFFINNGRSEVQGVLFFLLFTSCGFLMLDRKWGFIIGFFSTAFIVLGVYNTNTHFSVFNFSSELSDPAETGNLRYFSLIPFLLNIYLISEFVKARQKAEKQLSEQKQVIEEKQKDVLDSIRYAKRIQNSLMPTEKYIENTLRRMNKRSV